MSRKTNSVGLRLKTTNKDYNHCWYGDILYGYNFERSLKIESLHSLSLQTINILSPKTSYIGAYKKANLLVCYLDVSTLQRLSESFNLKTVTREQRKEKKQLNEKVKNYLQKKCPKNLLRYKSFCRRVLYAKTSRAFFEKEKYEKSIKANIQSCSLESQLLLATRFGSEQNNDSNFFNQSALYKEKTSALSLNITGEKPKLLPPLGLFFRNTLSLSLSSKGQPTQSNSDKDFIPFFQTKPTVLPIKFPAVYNVARAESSFLSPSADYLKKNGQSCPFFLRETSSYVTNLIYTSGLFWGNFVSTYFVQSKNEKASALFLAHYVSYFLERKVQFRRIKRILSLALEETVEKKFSNSITDNYTDFFKKNQKYIAGCKISCSGRVGGRSKKAQRSRKETFTWGETGLHVFSSKLDFAKTFAFTPFGLVGIQVWICYK